MTDLQVGPSVENPNKQKHATTHEYVSEKQQCYNKKVKESRNKVDRFKIDDFVCIKSWKNYVKIAGNQFGITSTYISTSRLHKCTQTSVYFD